MIIRTYFCDNCEQEFEVTCESNSPDPDCPFCAKVLDWRPGMFAIATSKSRAVDVTQQILEEDYGLTNFNDNMREGDVATKSAPAPNSGQRDAEIRQLSEAAQSIGQPMTAEQANMAKNFWGGGQAANAVPVDQMLGAARASTAAANAEGLNPLKLLHDAGKAGKMPIKISVIASDNVRPGTYNLK